MEAFDQEKDPPAPWKTLNAMLAENPPPAKHEQVMKQFATIGIGPRLDVEEQDEVTKENLVRAAPLVPNPIDRYSLGDRSKGLKRDSVGGLTIYVQHESTGEDEESNWMPAPEGSFFVILRMYQPH
jgi:hypothetical protein